MYGWISARTSNFWPGHTPTISAEFKELHNSISLLQKTKIQGPRYFLLETLTVRLLAMTDASFFNTEGLKSHIGYTVITEDYKCACNVLQYGINKLQRVAVSFMSEEVQALVFVSITPIL